MENTDQEQIDAIRELVDISEYRVREFMNKFYPERKLVLKYADDNSIHPNFIDSPWEIIKGACVTKEQAEVVISKWLVKPVFHQEQDQPNYRILEHMNTFYPQKGEPYQFEEGVVVPAYYKKELNWKPILPESEMGYGSIEEAQELLNLFKKGETIYPYNRSEEKKEL